MAAIYLTDASGNATRYALPNTAGETLLLGSGEGSAVLLPAEAGIAPLHAQVDHNGTDYVLTDLTGNGGVMVNGQAEASVILVPGVAYFLGSLTLAYDPEMAEAAPAPAEQAAPQQQGTPKLTKAALPNQPARMRRSALASQVELPQPKQENILVTLLTPLYSIAILLAAFVAGLTLRYWLITGRYFPSDFFGE